MVDVTKTNLPKEVETDAVASAPKKRGRPAKKARATTADQPVRKSPLTKIFKNKDRKPMPIAHLKIPVGGSLTFPNSVARAFTEHDDKTKYYLKKGLLVIE
ncbi:hypothetical protein N9043_01100 [bacterium]|nr:hypothetical protein [bacterium]